jgi:hypothetical protein
MVIFFELGALPENLELSTIFLLISRYFFVTLQYIVSVLKYPFLMKKYLMNDEKSI